MGKDINSDGIADYYDADVESARDYYPFGMTQPGREFSGNAYRYGFNGKEDDKSWGVKFVQDYGFRLYNPALGRFLSVDPLTKKFAMLGSFQFASNSPVQAIDLEGLEGVNVAVNYKKPKGGTIVLPSNALVIISTGVYANHGVNTLNGEETITESNFENYLPEGTLGGFTIGGLTYSATYDVDGYFVGYLNEETMTIYPETEIKQPWIENYQSFTKGTLIERQPLELIEPWEDPSGGVLEDAVTVAELAGNLAQPASRLKSLRGQTMKSIIRRAKENGWVRKPLDARKRPQKGWKYVDKNGVERVRYRRLKSKNSRFKHEEDGYFVFKDERDNFLDIDGNIVKNPKADPGFTKLSKQEQNRLVEENSMIRFILTKKTCIEL